MTATQNNADGQRDAADAPAARVRSAPSIITLQPVARTLSARVAGGFCRRLRAVMWRNRLAEFGYRSTIDFPAFVVGGKGIGIGQRVSIWRHARIEALSPAKITVRIGDGTVIQPYAHIAGVESVEIGRNVLIASQVYISDHDHDFSMPDGGVASHRRVVVSPVSIGDGAWLGEGVMVLKGVKIGRNSVIGAGSVVTRDVPDDCVAAGVPAKVLRRFDHVIGRWREARES